MKKPKKSGAGHKRRQKENGQARLKPEEKLGKESPDRLSRAHEAKPREPVSPSAAAGRKPQRDDEQKRKLWERKQAELEARWLAAQSRQTDEAAARKRTARIVGSVIGTGMVVLLCAFAWYFLHNGGHIGIPA